MVACLADGPFCSFNSAGHGILWRTAYACVNAADVRLSACGAGSRVRGREAAPLQVARLLEERVAAAEGAASVRHWLSLVGAAPCHGRVQRQLNLPTSTVISGGARSLSPIFEVAADSFHLRSRRS